MDIKKEDIIIENIEEPRKRGMIIPSYSSGVRVTHLPTGKVIEVTSERHAYQNRNKVLQELQDFLDKSC